MKAAIIQPEYSTDISRSAELFKAELSLLDLCDESLDIIVMPEYGDIPVMPDSNETFRECVRNYHTALIEKAAQTAKRCNAFVFVNGIGENKNTTFAFNRRGELFGKYFKRHLTGGEVTNRGLSCDYALTPSAPYIIEAEGLRFGFLTCYDFYFYEAYSCIARQNVDIIIGCSHQRSDTHDTSELFSRFAAYNCNSFLLRSSVSMDKNSGTGGGSMVVSPRGEVLLNMKSRVGLETVEFDPKEKYYKPAGFGNEFAAHYEYVERGRCPWNYRPGGSAITLPDAVMSYPRLCAKAASNFSREEMLSYFGAAIALDVNEISFEITTGDEDGLLSEILRKFSCHAVMNIHISECDTKLIEKLVSLMWEYDCEKYIYFSSENDKVLKYLSKEHPQFATCYCTDKDDDSCILTTNSLGCKKIQFNKEVSSQIIGLAHSKGLKCNVSIDGDERKARRYISNGIDTLITKEYTPLLPIFKNGDQYINNTHKEGIKAYDFTAF